MIPAGSKRVLTRSLKKPGRPVCTLSSPFYNEHFLTGVEFPMVVTKKRPDVKKDEPKKAEPKKTVVKKTAVTKIPVKPPVKSR
jgi:hypothetical protein